MLVESKNQTIFSQDNVDEVIYKEFTYQNLLDYGIDCRRNDIKESNSAEQQIRNFGTTLRNFVKGRDLTLDSKIGSEFGTQFIESLQEEAEKITQKEAEKIDKKQSNNQARNKFVSQMNKWQEYYRALLQTQVLPADFSGALRFLIEKSGKTADEIEESCRARKYRKRSIMGLWANGTRRPHTNSLPLIHKIEAYFQLPPDTLTSRCSLNGTYKNWAILLKWNLEGISKDKLLLIAKRLPNEFDLLPIEEQKRLVDVIQEYDDENINDYRKRHIKISKDTYKLKDKDFLSESNDLTETQANKEIQAQLNEDVQKLVEFKTYDKNDGIPADYLPRANNEGWSPASVKIFNDLVSSFLGILKSPKAKNGMELKISQLSLILIILPAAWKAFKNFRTKRFGEFKAGIWARNLEIVINLTKPKYGWITQSAWLAERLQPIKGLLTEKDVEDAKQNWRKFVKKIELQLREIHKGYIDNARDEAMSRDSHLPILPILESDNPMEIIGTALFDYQKETLRDHMTLIEKFLALREIIILRIFAETALRAKNVVEMRWKKNNTEDLRKDENGNYYLEISHKKFKNSKSPYFGNRTRRRNFKAPLSETLTPLIDEYLILRREIIKDWENGEDPDERDDQNFLLVNLPKGKKQRISYQSVTRSVIAFSESLIFNPLTGSGLKGVQVFRCHAFRHIMATYILKKYMSYALAGAAIQDTEETARKHYAIYYPEDLDKVFRPGIKEIMEKENNNQ